MEADTFNFKYDILKSYFKKAIDAGYKIITCKEYAETKSALLHSKVFVNRIDVDTSVRKIKNLSDIFNQLGIKGSFFLRLHGDEYNPFSFENYRIVCQLIKDGHEIAYHSEIIDQSVIWNESAKDCLVRDVAVLEKMFNIKISGVASHGGITGLNNLDFWKEAKPSEFGLLYEAYDKQPGFNLFHESLYVSDSNYKWKSYLKGTLTSTSNKTLGDYIDEGHQRIYLNIHTDTYYFNHIYE